MSISLSLSAAGSARSSASSDAGKGKKHVGATPGASGSATAMSARVETERAAAQMRFIETLQVVHKATVLFYVRGKKSAEIAKTIRPELSKLIKASDQREAISLIERYNNSPSQQGINLVIADVDNLTVKLLETLKRRKVDDATKSYPLLPLILLVSPHTDPELIANTITVGGYDFMLTPPFSAKDVFESAVAALSRMESVQRIYADIHKYKEAQKFPYLPIFEHVNASMLPAEAPDSLDDSVSRLGLSQVLESTSSHHEGSEEEDLFEGDEDEDEDEDDEFNINLSSRSDDENKSMDGDATVSYEEPSEKQMILPEFVLTLRRETSISKLKSIDRPMDSRELAHVDALILKSLSSHHENRRKTVKQQKDILIPYSSSRLTQGQGSDMNILRKGSKSHQSGMKKSMMRTAADSAHKNPIKDFERPRWKLAAADPSAGTDLNPELLPFISHPAPAITHRSVAGLGRKEVKSCWKTIKSKIGSNAGNRLNMAPNTASFLNDASGIDNTAENTRTSMLSSGGTMVSYCGAGALGDREKLDSAESHLQRSRGSERQRSGGSSHGRMSPTATHDGEIVGDSAGDAIHGASLSSSSKPGERRGVHRDGTPGSPSATERRQTRSSNRLGTGVLPAINASDSPVRKGSRAAVPLPDLEFSKHQKKQFSIGEAEAFTDFERALFSSNYSEENENFGYMIQMRAKKHVSLLASKAPEDPDTGKIMVLKFTDRNLNFDVRDHLEEGFALQTNGKLSEAESFYDKAVLTGKSVSLALPLAMRGIVRFLQRKYLKAIKDFTDSIALYEQYGETRHDKADTAAALYNRALSYFRIGDDDSGVSDLKKALDEYDADNFQIREMLILAYRRVDKFELATEQCVILKERKDAKINACFCDGPSAGRSFDSFSPPPINKGASAETDKDTRAGSSSKRIMLSQSKQRLSGFSKSFGSFGSRNFRVVPTYHIPIATTDFSLTKTKKSVSNEDKALVDESVSVVSGALSLEHEKIAQGFSRNIFDTLFVNTTALQEALSLPTKARHKAHVALIEAKLKEISFFRELERVDLRKVAAGVEYRTISDRGPLFSQDRPMDVFCILLSGQWQLRVEIAQHVVPIWTLKEMDVYGAMDLLFRNPHSAFVQRYHRMESEDAKRAGDGDAHQGAGDEDIAKQGSRAPHQHKEIVTARALLPGSFMSCTVLTPTEVILIPANDFDVCLSHIAEQDFERRVELLNASGLFKGDLKRIDLVRMARMSQIESVAAGTTLLKQGEVPSRLYFVMKGICNVQKKPDRSERTIARIIEVKELIKDHDMKYSFHHKLRKDLSAAPVEFGRTTDHNFSTAAEYTRHELEKELADLEEALAREKSQPSEQFVADVTKLKWPMVFGENSVSLPDGRGSLGTIIAETYCEILSVHKTHLQTFHLMDDFQERLRIRSVKYPPDDVLAQRREASEKWSAFRATVLEDISKKRWPGLMEIAERDNASMKI